MYFPWQTCSVLLRKAYRKCQSRLIFKRPKGRYIKLQESGLGYCLRLSVLSLFRISLDCLIKAPLVDRIKKAILTICGVDMEKCFKMQCFGCQGKPCPCMRSIDSHIETANYLGCLWWAEMDSTSLWTISNISLCPHPSHYVVKVI